MTNLRDEARWIIGEISEAKRLAKAGGKPQLANSAIEAGRIEEYDQDGTLVQVVGEQHDGTHAPVTVNGPVPPEPAPPALTAGIGSVEARWSGKFDSAALSPMDFSHVALHASRLEVFTPSNETQLATITGELGDVAVVLLKPGEWTFALVAVSKAGKWSEMSETVTVDVPDYPSPVDIQDELILLDEKYDGVIAEAGNLGNRLDQAEEDLTAHEGRLGTAEQRVSEAFVQIDAADGKADAAAGVASAAQSKADTAAQAAADAAGIANGKGKVLVQSTAPGAVDRNAVTLWIDTTGGANTPKRWTSGTTWVAVTDKAATDAAEAAAQAAQVAANAQSAAGSAQATADNALTMAGTKGKVFYSTAAPSGTGTAEGDLWRRVDGSKNVIGEWYWSGSAWVSSQITTSAIANLDVGKLTVGTGVIADLVAQSIAASTAAFQTVDVKNLFVTTGTMAEAVINKLWADVVMSRKITAQMVAIGSFENLIPDDEFETENGDVWYAPGAGTGSGFSTEITFGNAKKSMVLPFKTGNPSTAGLYAAYLKPNYRVPVVPGETYYITSWVYLDATNIGNLTSVQQRVYHYAGRDTTIINALAGDSITAPPVRTWFQIGGLFTVPAGSFYLSPRATAYYPNNADNSPAGGRWFFSAPKMVRASNGELIVDGSVKAKQIDTVNLAANTGFIADLTARIVKSDMFVGKEFQGGTFTGSVFQTSGIANVGMKLDNQGLRAYGPEGGEPVAEIRPDGGTVYQVSDPTTGEVLGGIDSEGGLSGTGLAVSGEARIDGVLVAGGDPLTPGHAGDQTPGEYGPVFNGRSVFGVHFMNHIDQHPNVTDNFSWLTAIPYGMVLNTQKADTSLTWDAVGGQNHYKIRLGGTIETVAGRLYQVNYGTPAMRATDSLSGNFGEACIVRSAAGGSITAGGPESNRIPASKEFISNAGEWTSVNRTVLLRCPEDIPEGKIMLGIELYVNSGRKATTSSAAAAATWSLSVLDMGLHYGAYNGTPLYLDKKGTEPTPTPPPPEPARPKQYTATVNASWWRAYTGDNSQATHSTYSGSAAQGRTPYAPGNGVMRGLVGFPSQASRLSGATVKKIEVYVYAKSWHASAGGTACLGVHGHGSKPGSWSAITNDVKRQKMKRPEGRWITLPSSVHNGFKNGDLTGISFYPPGGSSSTEYYGLFTGNKTKLRVTYVK
ncbi:hypothetical protein ACTXL8_05605 [Glutamicibacter arilaitensis]|uniref:hypothetical protein n=1 Tax=Glutamicibacter arilaitensis TaxID=256701 RepID=UPI003FD0410B